MRRLKCLPRFFKYLLKNDLSNERGRSVSSFSQGEISLQTFGLKRLHNEPIFSANQQVHNQLFHSTTTSLKMRRQEYSSGLLSGRALQQQTAECIDNLPGPSNISFQDLVLQRSKTLKVKPKPDAQTLKFGAVCTDHMLQITWTEAHGWKAPAINPLGPLTLHPCSQVLHYAIECFEGMKAFRGKDGCVRLFRPDMNMHRLFCSAARIGLPHFDKVALLECIKELLRVEKDWIPSEEGFSLYIRPTMIATDSVLGLAPTKEAMLFVVLSPVGPYFPSGLKPIRLLVDTKHARAFPGGVGNNKVGGNYAPTLVPQKQAAERGCSQVLYVLQDGLGKGGLVGEAGAMNLFVLLRSTNLNEELELVTPALDGTILPGVTRDSVLRLSKSFGNMKVSERQLYFNEIEDAASEGRVIEVFGTGTACMIQPISGFVKEDGTEISLKFDSKAAEYWLRKLPGSLSNCNQDYEPISLCGRLTRKLLDIYYGYTEHPWSVVVN
ncbi:hypothetical protein O6H91_04G004900 [Diphasiastrum complanatum]|nr:hypothetical protein O6H91_04G004900 [Diphasiastrum complanatum]KAJ7557668.1 hypothetical protein O6H91_04G004900 [Diphasiastrum complanatum]